MQGPNIWAIQVLAKYHSTPLKTILSAKTRSRKLVDLKQRSGLSVVVSEPPISFPEDWIGIETLYWCSISRGKLEECNSGQARAIDIISVTRPSILPVSHTLRLPQIRRGSKRLVQ